MQVGVVSHVVRVAPARFPGVATTACATATPVKVSSTVPSECVVVPGTGWHWPQPYTAETKVAVPPTPFTCRWCAPTLTPVVVPLVAIGGAVFVAEPWQLVQLSVTASNAPFRWTVLFTVQPARFPVVQTYPAWQSPQLLVVAVGYMLWLDDVGGALWHESQAAEVVVPVHSTVPTVVPA